MKKAIFLCTHFVIQSTFKIIITNSTYNTVRKEWTSWIDLEITNANEHSWFSEYATNFTLPDGCWVKDYYLYVGDRKEMGILAEKKSAMWVFSQIRNENRDPGILYYMTGNRIAFRVFPFANNEVRKTGIQLVHREPFNLQFDGHRLKLGEMSAVEVKSSFENELAAYVSVEDKKALPKVVRKGYYHFIVDASKGTKKMMQEFAKRMETFLVKNPQFSDGAKISYANSRLSSVAVVDDWRKKYAEIDFEGGYNLDWAIKKTLSNGYLKREKKYPIIIAVTDSIDNAILDSDFSDFKIAFPESEYFYRLTSQGKLAMHSLVENSKLKVSDTRHIKEKNLVLEYTTENGANLYVADDGKPSIILKSTTSTISKKRVTNDWESGFTMQAQWMTHTMHPEMAEERWLKLVKSSFQSKIMTPVTSYLVVENEAQKQVLKKKQEQVLSGNKSLDLDEDSQRMSEPGLFLLAIMMFIFLWMRKRKLQANL